MASQSEEAPGRLDLIRAFENSVSLPDGPDELDTLERASRWCHAHGLPPVSNGRELDRLRAFREALREALFANNGEADRHLGWAALRPYARPGQLGLVLDPQRGPVLEAAGGGVERTIAMMLAIVYDAVSAGTWTRLRACRKSDCRYAYYDRSKNGSRAWCSMASCGNRAKAARRRSRERRA